uniref:Uncharacterized protein n=1 Tax=Tanacetum cinerariifolium TaxID=118510 RepID=A0A6L2KBL7_TANCI|nr:hypothetical protein [Tanacetum cinerariifolium]
MDSDSAHMMVAFKVPILKPENGLSLLKTQVVEGVTTLMPNTSVKDKAQRRLEVKARNLDTMSIDDLYNNLKVYEPEVKGMSSSNSSTQNMAFVSSSNNNSSNGAVNTALGVFTSGTQVNTTNIDNLSDVVISAFMASQPRLDEFANKPVVGNCDAKTSKTKPKDVRKNNDAPIIEE